MNVNRMIARAVSGIALSFIAIVCSMAALAQERGARGNARLDEAVPVRGRARLVGAERAPAAEDLGKRGVAHGCARGRDDVICPATIRQMAAGQGRGTTRPEPGSR